MRGKDFLLQFLVNILPLDPDPDSGSQNVADSTDPDSKHCTSVKGLNDGSGNN